MDRVASTCVTCACDERGAEAVGGVEMGRPDEGVTHSDRRSDRESACGDAAVHELEQEEADVARSRQMLNRRISMSMLLRRCLHRRSAGTRHAYVVGAVPLVSIWLGMLDGCAIDMCGCLNHWHVPVHGDAPSHLPLPEM